MKGGTEGEVMAAHELALQTKYTTEMLLSATGSRCSLGQQCDETTGHVHAHYIQKNCVLTFKRRIKSHLPFAGIIRSLYSTRLQDKG